MSLRLRHISNNTIFNRHSSKIVENLLLVVVNVVTAFLLSLFLFCFLERYSHCHWWICSIETLINYDEKKERMVTCWTMNALNKNRIIIDFSYVVLALFAFQFSTEFSWNFELHWHQTFERIIIFLKISIKL